MKMVATVLVLCASTANAAGDAKSGATLYADLCSGCHAVEQNGIGPRHAGVFGRKAGTQPGYTYSQALLKSGFSWTPDMLRRWLTDPGALVVGNKMAVKILETDQERDDVIAYLKSLGGGTQVP